MARLPDDIAHRRELLREMLRVRRFEERCVELYSATKIRGFLHLYIGAAKRQSRSVCARR